MNFPNLLTTIRIILVPLFIYIFFSPMKNNILYGTIILFIIGLTDILDGYIARKYNMITKLGTILDPIADKLTQGALVLALSTRYPLMIALVVLFVIKESGIIAATYFAFSKHLLKQISYKSL